MIISNIESGAWEAFTFYIPLCLCILSIFGGIFVIATHNKFIRMRLYSGRLIFHATIIQLIISIIFGISLFYESVPQTITYPQVEDPHPSFVIGSTLGTVLGAIEVYISLCYFLYHFCISHNLYYCASCKTTIDFKKRHHYYIGVTQSISFLLSLLALVTDQINLQDIGVFGIGMKSSMQFIYMLIIATVLPFSIYTIFYAYYYNRKLDAEPILEESYEREIRHDFVNTNSLFLVMFIITWMPYAFVSYVGYYDPSNCACYEMTNFVNNIAKVGVLNLVSVSAFCSAIIKLTRPVVLKEIKNRFSKRKNSGGKSLLEDASTTVDDLSIRVSLDESLLTIHPEWRRNSEEGSCPNERCQSLDESLMFQRGPYAMDAFNKKRLPVKKPVTPGDHLDIVLTIIFCNRNRNYSENINDYPGVPWTNYQCTHCVSEELDPNISYTYDERSFIMDSLKKTLTLHKIQFINHSKDVFNHLLFCWNMPKKSLERTFDFKGNIEFFANIHRKPFSHLEKRYFHVTPNKKILFQILEKESKIYFIDVFLSAYHQYMVSNESFLIKILGLYTFTSFKNNLTVMAVINNYEKFYKDGNREGTNTGIPSCIVERYLIDGKSLRHEIYNKGILEQKEKIPNSDRIDKKIFFLEGEVKSEIMSQLRADLAFLSQLDIINYKVVLLVTNDERRKNSLMSGNTGKTKYLVDGSIHLPDGCTLKIFIDTSIITSAMKDKTWRKKKNPMFSMENSAVYRQSIEELIDDILQLSYDLTPLFSICRL